MNVLKNIAAKSFSEKPFGYESNFEINIYSDGFSDGANFILSKLKERFTPDGLDSISESVTKDCVQSCIKQIEREVGLC